MASEVTAQINSKHKSSLTTKSHCLSNHLTSKATTGARLSRRYEQLLHAEKYYDCIFHIGSEQIKCHKLILAAASPVFEAMFFGPISESEKNIDILDISADIFKVLIHHIYTETIEFEQLNLEDAIELFYAAEKYLLNELIDECLYIIRQKLRFENILPALELSICMNLSSLIEICMTFFTRCCLSDSQFMIYLKKHYCHLPKDCLKQIIAASKDMQSNLLWFVYEWCEQECLEMGLKEKNACMQLLEDLQIPENIAVLENSTFSLQQQQQLDGGQHHVVVERSYFKATRPFIVDWDMPEWKINLKSERHISLTGIVLHSRLPSATLPVWNMPSEYNENLQIEIKAVEHLTEPTADFNQAFTWRHTVNNQKLKFNSDLLLKWTEGVLFIPDVVYELKLIWQSDAYGAEYPCSLMSTKVDCFQFQDAETFGGSILKGLRFINLV